MTGLRLPFVLLALFMTTSAHSGHGLMNTFSDVTPLPAAGVTPADLAYPLDRLNERARLAASTGAPRFDLTLDFAGERLAELLAMVRARNADAARTAIRDYGDLLTAAAGHSDAAADNEQSVLRKALARTLLEHRYLLALDYYDLPSDTRTLLHQASDLATTRYNEALAGLKPGFKAAQFFKEEEVRWSWEMALQADQEAARDVMN